MIIYIIYRTLCCVGDVTAIFNMSFVWCIYLYMYIYIYIIYTYIYVINDY